MPLDSFLILAAETSDVAGESILKKFQIHWWTFLAQLINFFIVVMVLKKFAYGPVMDILEKRRKRIEDGELKLAAVEKQIAESEERTQEMIDKANGQAKRMVEEARESAAAVADKKTQEAAAAAQQIIAKAEEAAKAEREQMQADLRKEFGRLVTSTTAQVTGKVLTDDDQRRINEEALAKVEG
ncbi:MAG: F0F1 ATP synthase subunit B [Akkermansiaceae bacterium]|nr:F0F1 ATP synthase subunit B [Akkermansiaceae bacterium]NNM30883.1 F0F1 ATP synthase subunit B [Akkermansiaceae bacterium]